MSGLRGLIARLAIGVAALAGCSGDSVVGGDGAAAGPCVTGQVVVCPCLGGGSGVQTCLGAAGFGACQCLGVDAAVFDGAWSDGAVNDLAPSTDQANLSDGTVAPEAGSADGSAVPTDVASADVPTAARTIGPAGGVVTLDGVRLEVPAGALSEETMIRITATTLPTPAGYTLYSPVYRFEPEGTVFARPVSLTLPFTGDVRLATAFWSRPSAMGGGYERLGGIPSASSITFSATHFSTGFVANGVDYTETADRSCVQTRLLDTRYGFSGGSAVGTGIPAGVALFFSVDDCQGRPIVGLTSADFTPTEDGSPVGSEGSGAVLPSAGQQVFVTLSIDLSNSTRPVLPNVIAAAIALVDKFEERRVPVQVGIDVFAGEATINAWQRHTLDLALVRTRLRALGSFTPEDASSTNLYGAIVQGVARLEAAEASFETRNAGGALALGYLVVFTDGADTSARVTIAAAQAAVGHRRNQVMALGLAGTDFTAAARTALQQVAGSGFVEAPSATVLDREFGYLATRIAGQAQRTYLLGYCSPRRSGTHRVGVTVRGATTRGEDGQFDATGFGPGCTVSSFTSACTDAQCGGLGCGACDDRTSLCNGASRQCVDDCVTANRCGGVTTTNPLGYSQTCTDQLAATACRGTCINTSADVANCGRCGNACSAGNVCAAGVCERPPPRLLLPRSTSRNTSQRPTLRWRLTDGSAGAHVDICSDRACTHVEQSADVSGSSIVVPTPLSRGAHFWRARSAESRGFGSTWGFWVGGNSTPGEGSSGSAVNPNGDGFADLVASSLAADPSYFGQFDGNARAISATPTYPPLYGQAVANVGDVNGDGYGDIVASIYSRVRGYPVMMVSGGSARGLSGVTQELRTPDTISRFSSAGDVNGDGYADFLAVSFLSYGGSTIDLYLGGADAVRVERGIGTCGADYQAMYGTSAGDVDGDGFDDVVVGARARTGGTTRGVICLYRGTSTGFDYSTRGSPSVLIQDPGGTGGDSSFGTSIAVADVDGDGHADLVAGTPSSAPSAFYVYRGLAGGFSTTPTATVVNPNPTEFGFGEQVSVGDFNGDGRADVVVRSSGRIYVFGGSPSGIVATPTMTLAESTTSGPGTNQPFSCPGDVNGDGFDDLAVFANALSSSGVITARLLVVYAGSRTGLGSSPWSSITAMSGGRALASLGGEALQPLGAILFDFLGRERERLRSQPRRRSWLFAQR